VRVKKYREGGQGGGKNELKVQSYSTIMQPSGDRLQKKGGVGGSGRNEHLPTREAHGGNEANRHFNRRKRGIMKLQIPVLG